MRHVFRLMMIVLLGVGLGFLGACSDDPALTTESSSVEVSSSQELSPEELGELGAEIEADPERLEELLEERGLTADSYEAAVRDISEDPAESRRYAEAYEDARG